MLMSMPMVFLASQVAVVSRPTAGCSMVLEDAEIGELAGDAIKNSCCW